MISQPLTGLHCLLEVSLLKKQKAEGYRRDIQKALEAASRLVESLRQARELAEAEQPGDVELLDLSQIVSDVAEEFAPLLQMTHITPITSIRREIPVLANRERLRRSVFYLFDNVLHDLPLGSVFFVSTEIQQGAVFYIGPHSLGNWLSAPDGSRGVQPHAIAIAERSLEAIGGRVCSQETSEGRAFRVEMPVVSR
jgi:signal transduction histidine kinase